tara:strand:- start:368 stop:532 length:165 start_codon:yes stop_codon:yes gene_type:complete
MPIKVNITVTDRPDVKSWHRRKTGLADPVNKGCSHREIKARQDFLRAQIKKNMQ